MFDNDRAIYIQIVEQIKTNIVANKIKSGEKLKSVREFAIEYNVNPNTMQKALQELERLGFIYTERTNGKFVTKDKDLIEKDKDSYIIEKTKQYLKYMKEIGISKEQTINYIKEMEE